MDNKFTVRKVTTSTEPRTTYVDVTYNVKDEWTEYLDNTFCTRNVWANDVTTAISLITFLTAFETLLEEHVTPESKWSPAVIIIKYLAVLDGIHDQLDVRAKILKRDGPEALANYFISGYEHHVNKAVTFCKDFIKTVNTEDESSEYYGEACQFDRLNIQFKLGYNKAATYFKRSKDEIDKEELAFLMAQDNPVDIMSVMADLTFKADNPITRPYIQRLLNENTGLTMTEYVDLIVKELKAVIQNVKMYKYCDTLVLERLSETQIRLHTTDKIAAHMFKYLLSTYTIV